MWTFVFCDTITGEKVLTIDPAAGPSLGASTGSWGRRLNSAPTSYAHAFPLPQTGVTREQWRAATTPWARTLVQCWNDVPQYAGVIFGRPYKRATHTVTIKHFDIRQLFLARYPFGINSYWENEGLGIVGKLQVSSLSLEAAFMLVLEQALITPTVALGLIDYSLPIPVGSTTTPGDFSAVYENYHFQKVSDIWDELQEQESGPDSEFAPQWSGSDTLEWIPRVGTLTGGSFAFDLDDPDSPVSDFDTEEDALKQVTGVFGIGQGFNAAMVVGGTPGESVEAIPGRDDVATWKTVKTNEHAAALAAERLAKFRSPTFQPVMTVSASEVDPTTLVLGSSITTTVTGDPWLPDDDAATYRLIGLSGSVGDELALTVEPVLA